MNLDNLPGETKNNVFSLVSDEIRLDVHNNAPDGLGGLNSQVEVNIFIKDVQWFFDIDGSRIDCSRVGQIDEFTKNDTISNSSE